MVNFLGGSRNRNLNSVISNASNDSGASLDASPAKISRPNSTPRKQRTSNSSPSVVSKNNSRGRENSKCTPTPSAHKKSSHAIPFDSRDFSHHDTTKSISRFEARIDSPRDEPPTARTSLQLEHSILLEEFLQPYSQKSSVTIPKGILKTGKSEAPSLITPASSLSFREKESWFSRPRRGFDDETVCTLTSLQTIKTRRKGLFSRFGGSRRDASDTTDTASLSNETKGSRRVSMNPIVVTVGGSEGDQEEETTTMTETSSAKTHFRDPPLTKSPQHHGLETGMSNFAANLASLVRLPASTISRSSKRHDSDKAERIASSPRSTSKQTNTMLRLPLTPRQELIAVDRARQDEWIVTVIEAIHNARGIPYNDDDDDFDSSLVGASNGDDDDSDILAAPRAESMLSGDDVSVSSIEMLFQWMTCTMDYPQQQRKDPRGMEVVAGDDCRRRDKDGSTIESRE